MRLLIYFQLSKRNIKNEIRETLGCHIIKNNLSINIYKAICGNSIYIYRYIKKENFELVKKCIGNKHYTS